MEEILVSFKMVNGQLAPIFKNVIPTAEQYDELIAALGRKRALIGPPVPSEPPAGYVVPLVIQDNQQAHVGRELDGSSVVMVRHAGYGWLGFRYREGPRTDLIDALTADEQSALQKPTAQ